MKKLILIALLLTGCSEPMENHEMIDAVLDCMNEGYDALIVNENNQPVYVVCQTALLK